MSTFNSLERNYIEKRDFIRMQVDTPAQIEIAENGTQCDGVCNDLSGGGMLVTLSQELPLNTELFVKVGNENSNSLILNAKCTIARIEPGPNDTCLVGLAINEIIEQG